MSDVTLNLKVVGLNEIKDAADNMARLGTVVGEASGDFRLTGSQILRYVKAANTLERETRRLTKAEDQGIITTQRKKSALEELERKLQKQILLDKSVIKSSKEVAAREKAVADRVAATATKYDTSKTVQQAYNRELSNLDEALAKGAIEHDVYAAAVARVKREHREFMSGMATGANQFAKYDMALYKSTQRAKRFASVGMQQAGYQVGDFIVQLQSGQNALVAFGQQGSQLAGIFGPYGAVVGALIAATTAFFMFKKAAEGGEEIGVTWSDSYNAMKSATKSLSTEILMLKENIESNSVAMGMQGIEAQKLTIAQNDLWNENNKLKSMIFEAGGGFSILGYQLLETDEQRLENSQKLLEEVKKQEAEAKRLRDIEEEQKEFLEDQLQLRKKLRAAAAQVEEDADKATRNAQVELWTKERQLKVLSAKASGLYTEKQIQGLVNDLAKEELRLSLENQLVDNDIVEKRVAQLGIEQDLTAELKEQLRLAKLHEEAFGTVYGMMEGSAGAKALRKYGGRGFTSDKDPTDGATGKSIYDKKKKTGKTELERLLENYDKYIAKLQTTSKVESELVQVFGMERRVQEQLIEAKEKYAALGEKVDHKELERTIRQIEADKQRHKFLQKAAKDRKKAALEEGKAMEDLFKSMESSFGDALMTIADGTKSVEDSFKTMAHAIIKELYQIFVVKQITGFVSQSAQNYMAGPQQGPTLSGAPLGGNYLPSGDGGGYTGNAPRSGGLDGKGGFMAMLHPRETVIDHTKGGSSGVVVNQTINVSTGVQQTVRAEVMGLMPQIAAASKGAVLDAKRRGGAYAGAF